MVVPSGHLDMMAVRLARDIAAAGTLAAGMLVAGKLAAGMTAVGMAAAAAKDMFALL